MVWAEITKGLRAFKHRLFEAIGPTQFPDVLLEVDEATRFSWTLLGRPPRRERELVTVYAALIAHGSHLTPSEVVRMVPTLTPDVVSPVMERLEMDDNLREANEAVLTFMRKHAVTGLWGDGMSASSDMMSL